MRKIVFIAFSILLLVLNIYLRLAQASTDPKPKIIGILIPMEHAALTEIVSGFEKTVRDHFKHSVTFKVQNAQGDIKLQRNIVELMVGQNVDMIVPIGTSMTQMALALVKKTTYCESGSLISRRR